MIDGGSYFFFSPSELSCRRRIGKYTVHRRCIYVCVRVGDGGQMRASDGVQCAGMCGCAGGWVRVIECIDDDAYCGVPVKYGWDRFFFTRECKGNRVSLTSSLR